VVPVATEVELMKFYVLSSNRNELTGKHLLQRLYITLHCR